MDPAALMQALQGQAQPGPDPDQQQDTSDPLGDALDAIKQALSRPDYSEADKLALEKVTTLIQQVRATHEKERQAALGGSPATNFLTRTHRGG